MNYGRSSRRTAVEKTMLLHYLSHILKGYPFMTNIIIIRRKILSERSFEHLSSTESLEDATDVLRTFPPPDEYERFTSPVIILSSVCRLKAGDRLVAKSWYSRLSGMDKLTVRLPSSMCAWSPDLPAL